MKKVLGIALILFLLLAGVGHLMRPGEERVPPPAADSFEVRYRRMTPEERRNIDSILPSLLDADLYDTRAAAPTFRTDVR